MSRATKSLSSGVGLSYTTSFWLWASVKAALNHDWMLSLITLTTLLLQARKSHDLAFNIQELTNGEVTISMAALFDQSSGILEQSISFNRTLELRRDPLFRNNNVTYDPHPPNSWHIGFRSSPYIGPILEDTFATSDTDWMYTALLQTALNGPEPPWSRDGWSFIPLDLYQLPKQTSMTEGTDVLSAGAPELGPVANFTVRTPAVRARLECNAFNEAQNASHWLDFHNATTYNISSYKSVYVPNTLMLGNNTSTWVTAQAIDVQCCFNSTRSPDLSEQETTVTLGYWTETFDIGDSEQKGTNGNLTIKWIHGTAGFAHLITEEPSMFFPEPPNIQALMCVPRIETAKAEVTVDSRNGHVQRFQILEPPNSDDVAAWSDEFQLRNCSEVDDKLKTNQVFCSDVTTR
jgi:hypothetical protein